MINNQDRKQIALMKHFLDEYVRANIPLGELLKKLDDLARSTTPKASWKKVFFDNWLNLESINTASASVKRSLLSSEERSYLYSSIKNIGDLIDDLLSSYENVSDNSVESCAREINTKWLMCPTCADAWENDSKNAMVICPKCNEALHNPRFSEDQVSQQEN